MRVREPHTSSKGDGENIVHKGKHKINSNPSEHNLNSVRKEIQGSEKIFGMRKNNLEKGRCLGKVEDEGRELRCMSYK